MACFTTSIGLISSISNIFAEFTKNKVSYKFFAIIIALVSLLLSALGVESIIRLTGPFLQFVYPLAVILVIFNLFGKDKINKLVIRNSFVVVTVVSFIDAFVSLMEILSDMFNVNISILNSLESILKGFVKIISLNIVDFPWVVPVLVTIILTSLYLKLNKNK